IYNSYGLQIVAHEPFESTEKAIALELDILSTRVVVEKILVRKRVRDTDVGLELMDQIDDLKLLLNSYRRGSMKF
ncbi:fructose-bisphosphatase class III, partial [Turicibacter sanguinis]|nr:fructose-bisphosphatase class III [Turicibacter sanguinis]